MKRRCVEFVVERSDAATLLWPSTDMVRVASDDDDIGRAALEIAADPDVPDVEQGAPTGRWHKLAGSLLDQYLGPQDTAAEQLTGLHVVMMLQDGELAVVWPPKGRCRTAKGPEALGAIIKGLLDDETQPRCPSGPPTDATGSLLERGAAGLGKLLQEG